MKYLCLAYEEEKKLNALSQSEWDALRSETLAYVEALRKSGHLIVTHALQSVQTASTVRVRSGKQSVTDGPFAETKEQLGGFFLIDARDLNEAIQVASRWPSARLGSIEVRPIEEELRQDRRYGKHDLQVKFDGSSIHDIHRADGRRRHLPAFVASDRASAMTGAIANLTSGSLVEGAIFLSFPQQLIHPGFLRLALDRLESERIVFFTGGVTNGS